VVHHNAIAWTYTVLPSKSARVNVAPVRALVNGSVIHMGIDAPAVSAVAISVASPDASLEGIGVLSTPVSDCEPSGGVVAVGEAAGVHAPMTSIRLKSSVNIRFIVDFPVDCKGLMSIRPKRDERMSKRM